MGALRFSMRAIGFVRIAILARILIPSQFGVFGVASLTLAFLEMLTETGINVFLIQKEGKLKEYLDTAWVVSIARGALIASLLFLFSPLISSFFNSPESVSVLRFMSLIPLLRGFINPAIVRYQQELQFNKEFILRLFSFLADTLVAIAFAFITRSAISLVWGLIAGVLVEIIISFVFLKPLPILKFESGKIKKVVSRGKWVTLAGIFDYFFNHGDDIVVGRLLDTFSLGLYQVAYRISTLPITEVADVFNKVAFPVYVNISGDLERLKKAYIKTTLTVAAIAIPVGLVFYLFPNLVVELILGPNWAQAAQVLRVLAVFGVVRAISGPSLSLYLSVKKQEYVTGYTLLSILGLAVTIIPLVKSYGIVGAGISANVGLFVSLPLMVYYSTKIFTKK